MKIYRIAMVFYVSLLVACANPANNLNSLRGDGSEHLNFESGDSYRSVYEIILKNGKKCWNLAGAGIVEGKITEDEKKAAVIFSIGEADYYIVVDISAMSDSRTSVSISHRGRERAALAIRNWLEKGSDSCD